MIRRILGTSRFLVLVAVLGSFIASATLQIFGLLRVGAVIVELVQTGALTAAASKSLIADTVGIIDIFLIGTVMFLISAGLYQLFVSPNVELPGWLTIESLDDLKELLTEVIIVALLVAFLSPAIEWDGSPSIIGLGVAIAAVIVAVAALTWASAQKRGSPVDRVAPGRSVDVDQGPRQ
jgi:uncharacterized membrane protein YqhA